MMCSKFHDLTRELQLERTPTDYNAPPHDLAKIQKVIEIDRERKRERERERNVTGCTMKWKTVNAPLRVLAKIQRVVDVLLLHYYQA